MADEFIVEGGVVKTTVSETLEQLQTRLADLNTQRAALAAKCDEMEDQEADLDAQIAEVEAKIAALQP
jgi:prefoldin subunit 5